MHFVKCLGSYWMPEAAPIEHSATLNGPLILAVAVSVAYVILFIVLVFAQTAGLADGEPVYPPPNQPAVESPPAAKYVATELNGPRTEAVAVSVAYVIRCTVEVFTPVP